MQEPTTPTPEQLAENPLLMVLWLALSGWFLLFFASFFISWAFIGYRYFNGLTTLSVLPWKPRKWSGVELLLAFIAMVVCQVVGVMGFLFINGMNQEEFSAMAAEEVPLGLAASISGLYLVATSALTIWICARYRVSVSHVGWTSDAWRVIKIGVLASAAIVPLIFALNAITAQLGGVDYSHPLFEAMEEGGSLPKFLYAVLAAAIVAPIAEEFLFRGLLQGWLQSIPFRSLSLTLFGIELGGAVPNAGPPMHDVHVPSDSVSSDSVSSDSVSGAQAPGDHTEGHTAAPENAFRSPTRVASEPSDPANPFAVAATNLQPPVVMSGEDFIRGGSGVPSIVPPIWPSIVAGVLFGLAHWGYGLSWIPLSVFGFSLGMLYRATHSIWPSVIVHFAMNGTSMFAMGVMMYSSSVTG